MTREAYEQARQIIFRIGNIEMQIAAIENYIHRMGDIPTWSDAEGAFTLNPEALTTFLYEEVARKKEEIEQLAKQLEAL